jgi:hypothetical protein
MYLDMIGQIGPLLQIIDEDTVQILSKAQVVIKILCLSSNDHRKQPLFSSKEFIKFHVGNICR